MNRKYKKTQTVTITKVEEVDLLDQSVKNNAAIWKDLATVLTLVKKYFFSIGRKEHENNR